MKNLFNFLCLIMLFLGACKKDNSTPPVTNVPPIDTINRYTGTGKSYDQLGYEHLGRFATEHARGRKYYFTCMDMNLVNTIPELISLQFWEGKPLATKPVYGQFMSDSFSQNTTYNGCYTSFGATTPQYTYNYKISNQGTVYNYFTRANLAAPSNYDLFVCDNKGTAISNGLFSSCKPTLLLKGGEYFAYGLGESVVAKGSPVVVYKLDKATSNWTSIDTIDYTNGSNTTIDATISETNKVYVCVNSMPTNQSFGKLRIYQNNNGNWDKAESSVSQNMADSSLSLGYTMACQVRFIPNADQPYVAVLRDNQLSPLVTFFKYDGTQVSLFNQSVCTLEAGILPSQLNYTFYDNQILTYGISSSFDYARTIYKVTPLSGFTPYKSIPVAINRKIAYIKTVSGNLYIAMKEIWSGDFFPTYDRYNEYMDLLKLK